MTPGEGAKAQDELASAEQALRVGRLALDEGAREDGVSRLYYAAFHAARAALLVRGAHARTHRGQVELFQEHFGVTPLLERLRGLREQADYSYEGLRGITEDLPALADEVEAFLERCRGIVEEALERGPDEPDPPPDY